MNWYVAELIVEVRIGREPAALWDQALVVIRERSARAAYATAMKLGRKQNLSYRNEDGETVRWRFRGLGELDKIDAKSLRSGTEVHSRLARGEPPTICAKPELAVFWIERDKHRTVRELLGDDRPASVAGARGRSSVRK